MSKTAHKLDGPYVAWVCIFCRRKPIPLIGTMRGLRKEAIKAGEEYAGMSWDDTRRLGYLDCIKVTVS